MLSADSGSRALHASSDLVELLRLAQGACERVEQEVHGAAFEHAELLAGETQRLRRQAERLQRQVEQLVSEHSAGTRAGPAPLVGKVSSKRSES